MGSYIGDYVDYRGGSYRLIALADSQAMTPMILNRITGVDETGTLYIGVGGWRSTVSDCSNWFGHRSVGGDSAGNLMRGNEHLKKMFPIECLAVTRTDEKHPLIAEGNLLRHYFESFGESRGKAHSTLANHGNGIRRLGY